MNEMLMEFFAQDKQDQIDEAAQFEIVNEAYIMLEQNDPELLDMVYTNEAFEWLNEAAQIETMSDLDKHIDILLNRPKPTSLIKKIAIVLCKIAIFIGTSYAGGTTIGRILNKYDPRIASLRTQYASGAFKFLQNRSSLIDKLVKAKEALKKRIIYNKTMMNKMNLIADTPYLTDDEIKARLDDGTPVDDILSRHISYKQYVPAGDVFDDYRPYKYYHSRNDILNDIERDKERIGFENLAYDEMIKNPDKYPTFNKGAHRGLIDHLTNRATKIQSAVDSYDKLRKEIPKYKDQIHDIDDQIRSAQNQTYERYDINKENALKANNILKGLGLGILAAALIYAGYKLYCHFVKRSAQKLLTKNGIDPKDKKSTIQFLIQQTEQLKTKLKSEEEQEKLNDTLDYLKDQLDMITED